MDANHACLNGRQAMFDFLKVGFWKDCAEKNVPKFGKVKCGFDSTFDELTKEREYWIERDDCGVFVTIFESLHLSYELRD